MRLLIHTQCVKYVHRSIWGAMYGKACLNVALNALLASLALNWYKKINFLATDKNVKKKKGYCLYLLKV